MINWIYAVLVLLFDYIGHFYGLKGVATGVLIATLLHYIFTTILAVNVTKIQLRQLLQVHLGGITLAVIVWLSSIPFKNIISPFFNHFILELLVSILLFLLIYLVSFVLFPYIFIGYEGKRLIKRLKNLYKSRTRETYEGYIYLKT